MLAWCDAQFVPVSPPARPEVPSRLDRVEPVCALRRGSTLSPAEMATAQLSLARPSSRVIASRQIVAPRRLSAALPRRAPLCRSTKLAEVEAASKHGKIALAVLTSTMRQPGAPGALLEWPPPRGRRPKRAPPRRQKPCAPSGLAAAEKKSKREEEEEEWDGGEDDGLNPQQARGWDHRRCCSRQLQDSRAVSRLPLQHAQPWHRYGCTCSSALDGCAPLPSCAGLAEGRLLVPRRFAGPAPDPL